MLVKKRFTNGMLTSFRNVFVPDEKIGKSAAKEEYKHTLKVTVDDIEFDADKVSLGYISTVMNIANAKYNKLVGTETATPAEAYVAVYESALNWKDSNNNTHSVKIETLVTVAEQAMLKTSEIIGVENT